MVHAAGFAEHPYLEAKGHPEETALVLDGTLVVPIRIGRFLSSVQTISETGAKRFLSGGKVRGGAHRIGRAGQRVIVEGLATGLSVRDAVAALSLPVEIVVAFSAGNLPVVSRRGDIVVADHDPSGAGEAYAKRTGCAYWLPPEPGDANDYHLEHGLEALTAALRPLLAGRPDKRRRSWR